MKVVAISGPSSSGKSTLTRCLHQVFPNSVILYEDDFYLEDDQIPVKDGLQDWDCPEAFDLEYLKRVLAHAHEHGQLPEDFKSKEEQNSLGPSNVSEQDIEHLKQSVRAAANERILFVDGIMLYHRSSPVFGSFDLRLFFRSPYSVLKERRNARTGYVTLQDFWTDPPGYFDDIVWPQYVNTHSYLFQDKDIEGALVQPGINTPTSLELNISQLLHWAVPLITSVL